MMYIFYAFYIIMPFFWPPNMILEGESFVAPMTLLDQHIWYNIDYTYVHTLFALFLCA